MHSGLSEGAYCLESPNLWSGQSPMRSDYLFSEDQSICALVKASSVSSPGSLEAVMVVQIIQCLESFSSLWARDISNQAWSQISLSGSS
jgi:hypothetical protein